MRVCVRLFVFHGDAQKRVKFSLLRTTTTTTTSQAGRPHSVFRSNCSTGAACRLAKKNKNKIKKRKKNLIFLRNVFFLFCFLLLADFIYLFVAADVVCCLETTTMNVLLPMVCVAQITVHQHSQQRTSWHRYRYTHTHIYTLSYMLQEAIKQPKKCFAVFQLFFFAFLGYLLWESLGEIPKCDFISRIRTRNTSREWGEEK